MKEINLKKYFTAIEKKDSDLIRIESEKINAAIAAAEGKAKVRKLTPKDVYNAISEIEDRLNIPKKSMEGIKVVVDVNANTFPNAYKYIPESTYFESVFKSGSWKLTDVYRYKTAGKTCGYNVSLTDNAKTAIISRLERF